MKRACTLFALCCSGCAVFAGKADYADYREIRLAPDSEARAVAMQRYVERQPHGQWRAEIQSARSSQDVAAFEAGKDTRQGLEHYLRAFPDGQFVAQARGRLSAVALIEQRKLAADRQTQELAEARKQRTEELRRTWIGRFIGYWTQTLTGLKSWGEPIADVARANPQFSRAFAAQPRPRCTQDECLKYYTSQFAVPVPGGNRLERTLSLVLRLRLKGGKLERAELLLPEGGFARWYELENRRAVPEGDPAAREQVIAWAFERALPAVQALEGLTPIKTSAVPVIDRPAIGPTGDLIDTSIEAPSDPQNRVSGQSDNVGIGVNAGVKPEPGVEDLVKPAEQGSPDMVFTPVGVGKQGQQVQVAPAPRAPAADGGGPGSQAPGEVMVIDPVAVPKPNDESSALPVATKPEPARPAEPVAAAASPGAVRGFQWQGLRISVFAASGGSGYDGLIIERATGAPAKTRPAAKPPAPPQ
jgi:hypothetical protein